MDRFAPGVEFVALGEGRTAYWRFLADLWRAGESFIIVEQDVEIHAGVVRALTYCPELWCVFPYQGPRNYGDGSFPVFDQALGCTRFRASLMIDHPALFDAIGAGDSDPTRARYWQGLDSQVAASLRSLGHRAHAHLPPATHHHRYPAGCACGDEDCEESAR